MTDGVLRTKVGAITPTREGHNARASLTALGDCIMMRSNATTAVRLVRDAMSSQAPVCIARDEIGADEVSGFVVSLSADWAAIQGLEEVVYLDGYELIRLADITAVEEDGEAGYVKRAVSALGRPVPSVHLEGLDGTRAALNVAQQSSRLVRVYLEGAEDTPMLVGRLVHFGTGDFDMQLVGPRGVWERDVARIRYRDVTRIGFGDRYTKALEQFGDEPADPSGYRDLDSFCTDITPFDA